MTARVLPGRLKRRGTIFRMSAAEKHYVLSHPVQCDSNVLQLASKGQGTSNLAVKLTWLSSPTRLITLGDQEETKGSSSFLQHSHCPTSLTSFQSTVTRLVARHFFLCL